MAHPQLPHAGLKPPTAKHLLSFLTVAHHFLQSVLLHATVRVLFANIALPRSPASPSLLADTGSRDGRLMWWLWVHSLHRCLRQCSGLTLTPCRSIPCMPKHGIGEHPGRSRQRNPVRPSPSQRQIPELLNGASDRSAETLWESHSVPAALSKPLDDQYKERHVFSPGAAALYEGAFAEP